LQISSIHQNYYDFDDKAKDTLRARFLVNLESQNSFHLRSNRGYASTHSGTYLHQVKSQLLHLFSNIDVTVATGTFNTGSGLVKLKESMCLQFMNNYKLPNTLASETFVGEQLVQLCEASARDASRYSVAEDGTHRLCLKKGDSWSVKAVVSVKSDMANAYSNSQLWELVIVQHDDS
jgi:hypothetical protein